jgi:hypothetical protein
MRNVKEKNRIAFLANVILDNTYFMATIEKEWYQATTPYYFLFNEV